MKPGLTFFILTSVALLFTAQGAPPVVCRGKPVSITMLELPGQKLTGPSLPLRFGGTRPFPRLGFYSEKGFRLVIKNRDEFSVFWKQLTAPIPPGNWVPPLPEIDFSKEMLVVAAMGQRPSTGYWIIIDGACEVDGQVEVFVSSVEDTKCSGAYTVVTHPADAVRIPRTDLPVVFRETEISCTQWQDLLRRLR